MIRSSNSLKTFPLTPIKMSSPIIVLILERVNEDDEIDTFYQAFSSSDSERSCATLLKDVYYTIGFQAIQPQAKHTLRGILRGESHMVSSCSLQERGEQIRCVIKNGDINTNYPIKGVNSPYVQNIPANAGSIVSMTHEVIDPFPFYVSDSDSDSDSS